MLPLLQALIRAMAKIAASESGELLSTRRKAHLLFGEVFTKMEREGRRGSPR